MSSEIIFAQAIVDGLLMGSLYALIAIGLAMIWGIVEIINFAHGEFLMIASFLSYFLFIYLGIDPLISIPLAFLTTFGLGYLVQKGIINRILEAPFLTQIFATFALLLIIRNGFFVAFGPDIRSVTTWYSEATIDLYGIKMSIVKLFATTIVIIATILLHLFLTRTYLGTAMRALSQDKTAAQLMGIDIKKVYAIAFGLGAGLAGIGGALLTSFYYVFPEMGVPFTLIAFISVVLGGFGNILGPAIGAVIIGVLQSIGALIMTPSMKDILVYIVFLAILLIKPTGIFSR
ncbi:MAG: branched-chain amino acid ABC transporter permease [Desulfurococcales archaeon]|jgi:branched-chain amino acid transport system permease protein|nr:branched-chain amino acid ABC transporter permease [Desulfurococcales archaeon]